MIEFNQQKYEKLLQEVPMDTLQNNAQLLAFERYKKQKRRKKLLVQTTLAAACLMLLFIGFIRFSPSFAYAISQIPTLNPLVKMIVLDKGIEDIVLNEYVEEINNSQTVYDKTLTITNVVADEYGMIISYKLQSTTDLFDLHGIRPEVTQNNEMIQGSVVGDWWIQPENTYEIENSVQISAHTALDYSSPNFELTLVLDDSQATTFTIPFTLKNEIKKSKYYPINQQITVDGQHFTIHELIISPIRSQLKMSLDVSNTKKILSFEDIRLYDENKEEWGKIRNGFTMYGSLDEQFNIMLESNYFRIPKSLTIEFNKIEAIAKADATIMVDFEKRQMLSKPSSLPMEVTLKNHYEIEYTMEAAQQNGYKDISYYLIDAQGDTYYSSSNWLNPQQFVQSFDQSHVEKELVNPVTIVISSFEQYLDGIGRIEVELEDN
ncbi:DUF4179 domain-containing protein [Metasolibacillus meyeri]|uniref:DUF4179 domain-containing protein n=1 Tax=Metasolibacillus meyeri TaxID=1071052 RepID=UPI000D30EC25|nr:DUF4179 domain-containing protein [Metasolibacillus meyeri]